MPRVSYESFLLNCLHLLQLFISLLDISVQGIVLVAENVITEKLMDANALILRMIVKLV